VNLTPFVSPVRRCGTRPVSHELLEPLRRDVEHLDHLGQCVPADGGELFVGERRARVRARPRLQRRTTALGWTMHPKCPEPTFARAADLHVRPARPHGRCRRMRWAMYQVAPRTHLRLGVPAVQGLAPSGLRSERRRTWPHIHELRQLERQRSHSAGGSATGASRTPVSRATRCPPSECGCCRSARSDAASRGGGRRGAGRPGSSPAPVERPAGGEPGSCRGW
jgi:hypothetical protein